MSVYRKWKDFVIYATDPEKGYSEAARLDIHNAQPYSSGAKKGQCNVVTEDVVLRSVKLADGRVVDDVFEAMEIADGSVTIWTKYRVWVIRSDAFMERLIFLPRNPPDSQV